MTAMIGLDILTFHESHHTLN